MLTRFIKMMNPVKKAEIHKKYKSIETYYKL